MLLDLSVQNLGVIESSSLVLGPGVSVLTGETGAGNTMLVQAIQLLTGGKADASMVRTGAKEATIEGRFETLQYVDDSNDLYELFGALVKEARTV